MNALNSTEQEQETRVCKKCVKPKSVNDFPHRVDAGLFRHTCKDCTRAQRSERVDRDRDANLARERERARVVRRLRPEINRRACANWRNKNRARYRALAKAYRERVGNETLYEWRRRNAERWRAYMVAWRLKHKHRTIENYGNEVLAAIGQVLPSNLTLEMKEDIQQSLAVAVLAGEIPISEIKGAVREFVREYNRTAFNRFKFISTDAPLMDGDGRSSTFGDLLAG